MVGNGMALVGTGPGQMCAPDVGQGGLQGAEEMWDAAGQPAWAVPSTMGRPHLPRLKQARVPDVSAGKERQGEESCQRAETAVLPTPTPVLPVTVLLPCHHRPCTQCTLEPQRYLLPSDTMT